VQVAKNSVLQQMCKQLQACGIANDTNYITMPTQYLHMRHPDRLHPTYDLPVLTWFNQWLNYIEFTSSVSMAETHKHVCDL